MFSCIVAKNICLVSGHCSLSALSSVSVMENLTAVQLLSPWCCTEERTASYISELFGTVSNFKVHLRSWASLISLSWTLFFVFSTLKVSPIWEPCISHKCLLQYWLYVSYMSSLWYKKRRTALVSFLVMSCVNMESSYLPKYAFFSILSVSSFLLKPVLI